jgi:hypothetical protein
MRSFQGIEVRLSYPWELLRPFRIGTFSVPRYSLFHPATFDNLFLLKQLIANLRLEVRNSVKGPPPPRFGGQC